MSELEKLKDCINNRKPITDIPMDVKQDMAKIRFALNQFREKYGLELYFTFDTEGGNPSMVASLVKH